MESASHDEIWDDSSLIDSWNEALHEYKKYHSIQARRGQGVSQETIKKETEALRQRVQKDLAKEVTKTHTNHTVPVHEDDRIVYDDNGMEDIVEDDAAAIEDDKVDIGGLSTVTQEMPSVTHLEDKSKAGAGHPAVPDLPFPAVGGGDEALKNLMMSWYYAGYYTGLYEGQQQERSTQTAPGTDQGSEA